MELAQAHSYLSQSLISAATQQLLKVKQLTRESACACDRWASTPSTSGVSSPPLGLTIGVEPGHSPSLPGPWPRPAMALLGAIACCLLLAWHCPAGLGFPGPAPAIGKSWVRSFPSGLGPPELAGSAGANSGKVCGVHLILSAMHPPFRLRRARCWPDWGPNRMFNLAGRKC